MIEFEYIKDIIAKNKFAIIGILIGTISLVGSIIFVLSYTNPSENNNLIDEPISQVEESSENIPVAQILKVDVKGAVKKAGVYELEKDSTIFDAIQKAGGITSKGTTANVNLSKKLTDEMVIYIFTKDEIKKKESTNELVCEIPKCECETIKIEECPSTINGNNQSNNNSTNDDKSSSETKDDKVSLNKALKDELMTLDGIGESKALAIIEYREKNGSFEKIEDIMNVNGIGEKAFEKIKDRLTL